MNKEVLINAINSKSLSNSLITIYYNIGRALPFRAQRFPDGRVSSWYESQYVEVHKIKPSGKGGKYGNAFGFYYRNGERANSSDSEELCWCKIDDTEPQEIPNAACGSWILLDILGEPRTEGTKVYELDDILEFGKHKGETLRKVIAEDFQWVEWAVNNSDHFFCNVDAVIEEMNNTIKVMQPNDVISFGKYKGKTVKEIYDLDSNYLIWLANESSDIVIDFSKLS